MINLIKFSILQIQNCKKTSCFVVTPGNPAVNPASKVFYNVWFFYRVVGKAHFGINRLFGKSMKENLSHE